MTVLKHLLGAISLTLITINLTVGLIPLLLIAFLKIIIPIQTVKSVLYQFMLWIYAYAVWIDNIILQKLLRIQFDVEGLEGLEKDKNYLVISNHRSWADILILQSLLIKGAPIIKFIVKKEIIFLPLVGLICWAYEYPFVTRQSIKNKSDSKGNRELDLNTINQSLSVLGKHPTSIINFVEGTRFNLLKSKKQDSPFGNLLKPRAGGLTYILKTFGHQIDFVLDFTIIYDAEEPVFWKLLNGTCRKIKVEMNRFSAEEFLSPLRNDQGEVEYAKVSDWLNVFWKQKDSKINQFLGHLN